LRSDKPAAQIVREKPVEPKKLERLSDERRNRRHASASSAQAPVHNRHNSAETVIADVKLTHPDKLLYPDEHITKRDLAEYYQVVQEWILPHVINRPMALVRCPNGQTGKCFFQRNWNATLPRAIDKVYVGIGKAKEQHVTVHDLSGIISFVQIGVLELHIWNCRGNDPDRPDQLVFDLDPGPDVPWNRVIEGARLLDRMLNSLNLRTYVKTSGGKGFHVTIPIEPNIDWQAAKSFCHTIADALVRKSDLFVANMRKDLRGGKVYIDYNRNERGSTAVAPYSTRARPGAPVSMPISWRELAETKSGSHFNVKTALAHLAKRRADPWHDFEQSRVDVRKIVAGKSAR
jgi:bifunctional non-homologous end joining protein LigD